MNAPNPAADARRRVRIWAAGLFLILSVVYLASVPLRASRGAEITGDEPFYLLTTQSLIQDGNLDLREQYAARSYRSFFDHPEGLWYQSVPSQDGTVLSPHNPGLSVLLLPGFALGGLRGAQVELLLLAALTFALTFVLAVRAVGHRSTAWLVTLGVAVCATPFVYATEIYPEAPAALALVASLLLATGSARIGPGRAAALVVVLSAIPWLGVKYLVLAAVVAGVVLWRTTPRARAVFLGGSALSAIAFVAWHVGIFGGITPYGVNTVYAGDSTGELLADHVGVVDRVYRIWGLLIDRRFGVGRWAPLLLLVVPGLVVLWRRRDGEEGVDRGLGRTIVVLIACQIAIGTFVAITMMGWWFPGRTMMTTLPLFAIPIASVAIRGGRVARASCAVLAVASAVVTASLWFGVRSGDVVLAVDPFDLEAWPFRVVNVAFPSYTAWGVDTMLLTLAWIVCGTVLCVWWVRRATRMEPLGSHRIAGAEGATTIGFGPVATR